MTSTAISDSPDQWLAALLDERAPQRLLLLGADELPALTAYADEHSIEILQRSSGEALADEPLAERVDLCLVQAGFVHKNKAQAITALAGIRNQYCHNIYLFIPGDASAADAPGIALNELLGLGMRKLATFAQGDNTLDCFGYEMLRYNKKRSWNNAKFWANPENFGKYWW